MNNRCPHCRVALGTIDGPAIVEDGLPFTLHFCSEDCRENYLEEEFTECDECGALLERDLTAFLDHYEEEHPDNEVYVPR